MGRSSKQEIANIGGVGNIKASSPSICPDCPSGADRANNLTQLELYQRMDIMCAAGITDMPAFTFFEIVQGPGGADKNVQWGKTVVERYFAAITYFKTGKKPW